MVAQLIRQNVDEHAEKKRALSRMIGRVVLVVEDLDLAITLRFDEGQLTVFHSVVGIPDLTIRASSEWHTKMSLVELEPRFGLPHPRKDVFREVVKGTRNGEIKVFGLMTSWPLMLRLTKIMSVASS